MFNGSASSLELRQGGPGVAEVRRGCRAACMSGVARHLGTLTLCKCADYFYKYDNPSRQQFQFHHAL